MSFRGYVNLSEKGLKDAKDINALFLTSELKVAKNMPKRVTSDICRGTSNSSFELHFFREG